MWQCEIRHEGLHKYRVVRAATRDIMQLRAEMQMRAWNEQWERVQATRSKRLAQLQATQIKETNKQLAAERTTEAQEALQDLDHLLSSVLEEDHAIEWDQLKNRSSCSIEPPKRLADEVVSREPDLADPSFRPRLNFLSRLLPSFRERAQTQAIARFSEARGLWLKAKEQIEKRNKERAEEYEQSWASHEAAKAEWLQERDKRNAAIEESRDSYLARKPEAVAEYCKMVLNNSSYPDTFPCENLVDYIEETRAVVVDFSLPDPSAIPTLKEVRYIAAREAFQEVHVTEAWLNRTYDSVLYQIALRSLYELFQADVAKAIESAFFNGWVSSVDKATGKETNACVLHPFI